MKGTVTQAAGALVEISIMVLPKDSPVITLITETPCVQHISLQIEERTY